ncbi:hypothetical protein PspLS_05355, partial [Pyricularia sp. CBS 133598]
MELACRGVSRNKTSHKVDRLTPAALLPDEAHSASNSLAGTCRGPALLDLRKFLAEPCPGCLVPGGRTLFMPNCFVLSFPDLVHGLNSGACGISYPMNKPQLLLETLEQWDGGAPRVVPIPNNSTIEATFDIHFEEPEEDDEKQKRMDNNMVRKRQGHATVSTEYVRTSGILR